MQYLLDTNTCIALMRQHAIVLRRIAAVTPGDCAISTVTSYELWTGVEKCANPVQERTKVDLLLKTLRELPFDSAAAHKAAEIRAALERNGQSIGPYDTLLAGHALSVGLVLITANTNEFRRVPGLTIETWQI